MSSESTKSQLLDLPNDVALDMVVNTMVDGLAVVDADGVLRRMNPAWLRLFRLSAADQIGSLVEYAALYGLRGPQGQPVDWSESVFARPLYGETITGEEVVVTKGDGTTVALAVSGAPVRDAQGLVRFAVLTCRDVTEARNLERLRDEYIATASHDLKNPLTTIKGWSQLLRRRFERDPARAQDAKAMASIELQTETMRRLIDELLDSSRVQAGRLEISPEPMDLIELVRQRIEAVQASSERHILELDTTETSIAGCWERERVGRVLWNLLTNAIKYSPDGGRIRVRVAQTRDHVSVRVADEGIGVPADQLPLLFGRFTRGAYATQYGIEGSGLGLFIAKGIVEAHGGTIRAESDGPGRGATFSFTLPMRAPGCPDERAA